MSQVYINTSQTLLAIVNYLQSERNIHFLRKSPPQINVAKCLGDKQ